MREGSITGGSGERRREVKDSGRGRQRSRRRGQIAWREAGRILQMKKIKSFLSAQGWISGMTFS